MLDAAPAQIRHMDEPVHAADIDKRAEIGQTADDTRNDFAFLKRSPYFLLLGGRLFHDDGLAGADDTLFLLIHLDDLELELFADEVFNLLDIALRKLGRRDERAHAAPHWRSGRP